jgi:hypothetical protein
MAHSVHERAWDPRTCRRGTPIAVHGAVSGVGSRQGCERLVVERRGLITCWSPTVGTEGRLGRTVMDKVRFPRLRDECQRPSDVLAQGVE